MHEGKTLEWANDLLMPAIGGAKIAEWDYKVDNDYNPDPPNDANWSWHFNRSAVGVEDSRLKHTREQFEEAKKHCTWEPDRKDEWEDAAKCTGRALHPLQDWVAHGDYNTKEKAGSLAGVSRWGQRHYWHNWDAPGVIGSGTTGFPDNSTLDAGTPDGRPTQSVLILGNTFSNGDRTYWTRFTAGSKRITLTETKTKGLLTYFQNHVKRKAKPCGKCRRVFLPADQTFGYGP